MGILLRFAKSDEGASIVEYGLLLALLAFGCMAAIALIGTGIQIFLETASDRINEVSP